MSFWTQLASTVGGALGGPIGAFAGGQIASAIQNNQPVQGPLTQQQQQTQNTLGALSTAVFQTYDDNKNAKINTANQNAVNAAQSANDQQLANQGTDLNKLRDSAEEAGFNPLTVLRATGGQGFNNNVNFVAPRLSSPTFWSTFTGNYQTNLQNTANLQNTYANTAYTGILGRSALNASLQNTRQTEALNAWGQKIEASNVSDAEEWERRYGDLLGSVIGIPIALSDGVNYVNKIVQTTLPTGPTSSIYTPMGDISVPQGTVPMTVGELSAAAMKALGKFKPDKSYRKQAYSN